MPYVIEKILSGPHQQIGEMPGWEDKVPDRKRRAGLSTIFKDGTLLFREVEPGKQELYYEPDPIPEDEAPDALILVSKPKRVPDAFWSVDGVLIVQQPVKDAIEALDPGLHQFLPIDVKRRHKGEGPDHPCFILNVQVFQESIDDSRSKVKPSAGYEETRMAMFINFAEWDVTIQKAKLSEANLWFERRYPGVLMMSDALHDALKARGLKFFRPHRVKEI